MVIYIPNEEHENLVFFDTEFDQQRLVQISMILYERIILEGVPCFLLSGSVNVYIKRNVSSFFVKHTGLTQEYIKNRGISEHAARSTINNFLIGLNSPYTLLIAHGVKQDAMLLEDLDIKVDLMEHYCTYQSSRRILNRENHLKLIDVCNEAGYFTNQHDAYIDAESVMHAYSYLKLVEFLNDKGEN